MSGVDGKLFYGWIVAGSASGIMLLAYGAQYSFGVFFSAMLGDLGWSRAGLAGVFSLYGFVYVALSFWSGRLTDRLGPRTVVALGGLCLGAGMILVSRIQSPWQLYLAYGVVAGVGMSAAYVPCNATVVKWFVRRRGLAVGIVGGGASLGIAVFPLLAEALIGRFGWRTSYLLFGVAIAVLLNLLARWLVRDPASRDLDPDGETPAGYVKSDRGVDEGTDEVSWTLPEARRTLPFWLLTGVMFLSLFSIPSAYVHLPQHAIDLGLGVPRSTFLAMVGLFALLGNLSLGPLADWLGRRGALLVSIGLGTAAFAGLATADDAVGLYLASASFGFYYGTYASLFPAVVGDFFGRQHTGSLAGFIFAFGSLSSAVGPVATGLIADRTGSYTTAFLCATAVNGLAMLLLALARPPPPERRARHEESLWRASRI